ncbi:hypothetical protein GPECTOR_11g283 [Gonium pectorale]|uniref:Uncharacterized protein n=1 Tax=Gonium pectorale TaxID=33097 RepID=A0A150GPW8_GONPE|nr:hypothetical protein GPECTOR_11g283 [Gonium pectorale]|eukprot:KXZ51844.1 hypothetical protein GPECTOR_11g283 [Gonium pectorale]
MAGAASAGTSGSGGMLWATCAVLFFGALLTGLPPLWWTRAARGRAGRGWQAEVLEGPGLRMLSAGLMLGSGLGVVLPEGFFAFVEGTPEDGGLPEWTAGGALLLGFVGMLTLQRWLEGPGGGGEGFGHGGHHHHHHQHRGASGRSAASDGLHPYSTLPYTAVAAEDCGARGLSGPGQGLGEASDRSSRGRRGPAPGGLELSREAVGPAAEVKAGAPETGPRMADGRPDPASATAAGAHGGLFLQDEGLGRWRSEDPAVAAAAQAAAQSGPASGAPFGSPGLALGGLLIHSAADGLAVGAASLGGGGGAGGGPSALSVTVAAAIMLHKLPVTFGLTAYLTEAGWQPGRVLRGLLAFSASAPLAALATFYLLSGLLAGAQAGGEAAVGDGGGGGGEQAVALAVLLSGGTFLAAATQHILPAALEAGGAGAGATGSEAGRDRRGSSRGDGEEGATEGGFPNPQQQRSQMSLVWLAAGAVLPLLIAALLPEGD